MAIQVQCPECGKSGKVTEDRLGKSVSCPQCGKKFSAQASTDGPCLETQAETAAPRAKAPTRALGGNPATATTQPAQIGRFQVRGRLGAGAYGTVYRAFDPHLERDVALKVAHPGSLENAKAVERFLREAKAAARLRHPHIVPVFDAGKDGEHYYIAVAFIEGKTLAGTIQAGELDFRQAARVIRQLAEALNYAHSQGIVHRDVKPANVMLDAKTEAHLTDFGIAHWQDAAEKLTQDGRFMGTAAYASPEQAKGKQVTPASDQYSVGVVLYELLCGETPFSGPPGLQLHHHAQTEPERPGARNPKVPRDLETICLKAMAKRAEDRYADCQAMADDLRRWLDGEPITARRLGVLERTTRWCRKNPLSAALLGAVAATLILGTTVAWLFALKAEANAEQAEQEKIKAVANEKRALAGEKDALEQKTKAEWREYAANINLAQSEWERKDVVLALHSPRGHPR